MPNPTPADIQVTLSHPDTVSGCTILKDGTRLHWSEGRSSEIDIRYPDGRRESVGVWLDHWAVRVCTSDECMAGEWRDMTEEEVRQHDAVRNGQA